MTTPRPAVQVIPAREFESRPRLFAALERAFGLAFTADPAAGVVATLVLGHADLSVPRGVPTLRLHHPEPSIGAPTPIRLADSLRLDAALRRQVIADGFAGATDGLRSSPTVAVLACDDVHALWTHDRSTAEEQAAVVRVSSKSERPCAIGCTQGAILPLLPLASFLLRVAEASGLKRAPLAHILIDDPNLHRLRYGYLDFEELLARSAAEGWHMAFATIPLDSWFVDRRAVPCSCPKDAAVAALPRQQPRQVRARTTQERRTGIAGDEPGPCAHSPAREPHGTAVSG